MKKFLLIFAGLAAFLAVSCTQEKLDPASQGGREVDVTFSAQLPDNVATKAFGEGQEAKVLKYAVYNAGSKEPLFSKTDEKIEGGVANVHLTLITGKTYDFIFWAQSAEADDVYEFDMDKQTLTVKYENMLANDESNDAFYAFKTITIDGAITQTIELYRPFAQINLGSDDLTGSDDSKFSVAKSSMKATLPSVLYLNTGIADTNVEAEFQANGIPSSTEKYPVAGYSYVEMNYVLVGNAKTTANFEFSIYGAGSETATNTIRLSNVPVQRNFRTNVYGSLITDPTKLTIQLVPGFEAVVTDNNEVIDGIHYSAESKTFMVYNENGLSWIAGVSNRTIVPSDNVKSLILTNAGTLADGGDKMFWNQNVKLAADLDLAKTAVKSSAANWTPINNFHGIFDGCDYAIRNMVVECENAAPAGLFGIIKGTVKNLKMEDVSVSGGKYAGAIAGWGDNAVIENCHVKNATVTSTPWGSDKVDDGNNVGGIIGLAQNSYNTAVIKNCSVKESIITGYRDVAGLVGKINKGTLTITDNVIEDVVVNCDRRVENYVEATALGAGEIVGRADKAEADLTTNTVYNVKINVIVADGVTYDEKNNAFSIASAEGLKWFADVVNKLKSHELVFPGHGDNGFFAGQTVRLAEDIDLSAVENWTPVGSVIPSSCFAGTFDGGDHTLSNLTINSKNTYVGFFGVTVGKIRNVKFSGVDVTGNIVGVVVGASESGAVENCHVDGGCVNGTTTENVGGIVGLSRALVDGCSAKNLQINAYNNVGGIVGAGVYAKVSKNHAENVTVLANQLPDYGITESFVGEIVGWNYENTSALSENTFSNVVLKVMGTDENGVLPLYDGVTAINIYGDEIKEVVFTEDVYGNSTSIGCGSAQVAGMYHGNGCTIDGGGNILYVKYDGNNGYNSGLFTCGGTIKNLEIYGGKRGLLIDDEDRYPEKEVGKVILENVIVEGVTYALHGSDGNGNGIEAIGCTFNGWSSWAATMGNVAFDNCTFAPNANKQNSVVAYAPTAFTGCTFNGMKVYSNIKDGMSAELSFKNCKFENKSIFCFNGDPNSATIHVTFENCYAGETLITQENIATLLNHQEAALATVKNN